jgi:hypothetical protein
LDGVDMRTQRGRRYRDIVDAVIGEFGAAGDGAIRELAGLRFTQEELQASIVNGTASNARGHADLVRLSTLIARRENEMRAVISAKLLFGLQNWL